MPRRRDESGSILPMTALLVVIVLAFTAFAVDLGLQRIAIRDMQSVADAVALDTARSPALASCDAGALRTKADESLARQGRRIGRARDLVVTPGRVDAAGEFTTADSGCNAVQVTAGTEVDFAFAPVIGSDSGSAVRSAVGSRAEPAVCFSAGTKTLVLDSSGSALGPLLDRILRVNLGVVGYSGLADLRDLSVGLADIAAELGLGTTEQLLGSTVSLRDVMLATATVLDGQGRTAQAGVLRSVAAQVGGLSMTLGRFLALDTTGDAGLSSQVDALDLIGTAIVTAAVANGRNAVALGADLGLPLNLLNANSRLTIVEPPRIACGRAGVQATTAQVRVDLRTGVNVLDIVSAADLDLGLLVGGGTARLATVSCTDPVTATIDATTAGARVVGYGGSGKGRLKVIGLSVLGIPLFSETFDVGGTVASSSAQHTFTYPAPPRLPGAHRFGSNANLTLDVEGRGLVASILRPVTELVTRVLNPALENLLTPLLSLLGIRLGTMDVTMLGRPTCSAVRLAG